MKYVRTLSDPILPGNIVSEKRSPGMHCGRWVSRILVGPDRLLAGFNLGNISSSRLEFAAVTYDPGCAARVHTHLDQQQAYYIISGKAVATIEDTELSLGQGHVALIPPSVRHSLRNAGSEPLTFLDIHSYQLDDVRSSELGVAEVTCGPQGRVEEHSHSDREEAYYILSGQAMVMIEDERALIGPGSVAFIPLGSPHGYRSAGGQPLKLVVVSSYDA